MPCGDPEGWEGDPRGSGYLRAYTLAFVCICLMVQQRLTQHCKATIAAQSPSRV